MANTLSINTYDLSKIRDYTFIIPAFQRDFVWSLDEVKKLLNDLDTSDNHFIGNIVTYKKENIYIVIDGQQRLTVLYILSKIAGIKTFKLKYDIRDKDNEVLKNLPNSIDEIKNIFRQKDINENFINVVEAVKELGIENNLVNLLNNAIFTITTLPTNIKQGEYYIKMNARGKQLEQYWIVRAKIFQKLGQGTDEQTKQEAETYKNIFDTCTNMKKLVWKQIFDLFGYSFKENDTKKYKLEGLKNIHIKNSRNNILNFEKINIKDDSEENLTQPLIRPEIFLLHVLNLWLKKENNKELNNFDDKKLSKIFQDNFFDKNYNIEDFIFFLLKIRILYDLFIFQRQSNEPKPYKIDFFELFYEQLQGDEVPHIQNEIEKQLILIQQLLHVTDPDTNGRKWISEALSLIDEILSNDEINQSQIKTFIKALEEYDNQLAKKRIEDYKAEKLEDILNNGTSTPHYWFYRTDYLLWKINLIDKNKIKEVCQKAEIDNDKCLEIENKNNILSKFYITQQQSVEHIIPQSEYWEQIGDKDKFGNLALISKGLNSKLSNQSLKDKKFDYEQHIKKYETVPSLKLWLALNKSNGDEQDCQNYILKQHHNAIIELLKFYINSQ